jgi:hypothetical protein
MLGQSFPKRPRIKYLTGATFRVWGKSPIGLHPIVKEEGRR